MKQVFLSVTVILTILALGCRSNHLNAVYVCDQSNKKADTTIQHGTYDEAYIDVSCIVIEFDFKGNSTVAIRMVNGQIFSSYIIDKEYVRIKADKSDILLRSQDNNTLVGEGFTKGMYHKK
jgi:hypothetical protein